MDIKKKEKGKGPSEVRFSPREDPPTKFCELNYLLINIHLGSHFTFGFSLYNLNIMDYFL